MKISELYCLHWLKKELKGLKEFNNYLKTLNYPYEINGVHIYIHIKDTIHYKALKENNYDLYEKLIILTDQKEHKLETFLKLRDNFNLNKMNKIEYKYSKKMNKNYIIDGVHRLSIMLYKNIIDEETDISDYLKKM